MVRIHVCLVHGRVGGVLEWVFGPHQGIMLDLKVRVMSLSEGVEATRERRDVGPNLLGDWEGWRPESRLEVHKHCMVICCVCASTISLQSTCVGKAYADGTR
jgi:hypothetical protein